MAGPDYTTIDEYISACEAPVQAILQDLRAFIKKYAPDAAEKLSWGMPTFYLNGNLVHFAAHKKHIGFYPGASGIERFAAEFEQLGLKYSKGAVQLPLGKDWPWDLIRRIVEFRVIEATSKN